MDIDIDTDITNGINSNPKNPHASLFLDPQQQPEPKPEDIVILVKRDNPNKLIFSRDSIENLQNRQKTVLSLESQPDSALVFYPSTEFIGTVNIYFSVGIAPSNGIIQENDCLNDIGTFWKFENNVISTDYKGNEYMLEVNANKFEHQNKILLSRSKEEWQWQRPNSATSSQEYQEDKMNIDKKFKINEDRTVSPVEHPDLILGKRDDANKEELLIEAIWINNSASVRDLLEQGANVNAVVRRQNSLGTASRMKNYELAERLLHRHNVDVSDRGIDFPPLHEACYNGSTEIVELLLKNGADPNSKNVAGTTALAEAAKTGRIDCIISLLNNPDTKIDDGPNSAISFAIVNKHLDCLDLLLQCEASLEVKYEGKNPIQLACGQGITTGMPLVKAILKRRGDLSQEVEGKVAMEILIYTYAQLSLEEFTHCLVRAFIKYHSHRDGAKNPFLLCMKLVEEVRKQWKKVRKTRRSYTADLVQLNTKLQLGAAVILKEIRQDQYTPQKRGFYETLQEKDDILMKFLGSKSSQKALKIAQHNHARIFFSQSVVLRTTRRLWYGDIINKTFLQDDDIGFIQVLGVITLILVQLPIVGIMGYFPTKFLDYESSKEMSWFDLKFKKPFILKEPFFMFMIQCVADLAFAIMFSFLNVDDVLCSITTDRVLLTYGVASALACEVRSILTMGIKNYMTVDPFNRLDLPAFFLATLSMLLSVSCPQTHDIGAIQRVILCVASILLWLRMLRLLTLFPETGPLTLMIYKMVYKMMIWSTILLLFVLAFASGLAKLNLSSACSNINTFAPIVFFEDAILADSSLFECKEMRGETEGRGFANVIIYAFFLFGNVMLINMLIAIMGESFSSVWEDQVANYVFQQALHCFKMRERKSLPVNCLYLFYGVYEAVKALIQRVRGRCHKQQSSTRDNFEDNPDNEKVYVVEKYSYDELDEKTLLSKFMYYILDHQDESGEDDHWRMKLLKKVSKMDQKVTEDITNLKNKIDDQKVIEDVANLGNKIDELSYMMKKILAENTHNDLIEIIPHHSQTNSPGKSVDDNSMTTRVIFS